MLQMAGVWFEANKLKVNHSKTEHLVFNLKASINENLHIKLLGIHIDRKLNWNVHTNSVCNKLAKIIFLLKKLKNNVSHNLLLYSYYGFFHSQLLYGILLWGNSVGARKVFKWQKKAIRSILGLNYTESCKTYFKALNIMTVPSMYIYNCLIYAKENMDKLTIRCNIHSYNTRNNHSLDIPLTRLTVTHNSYKILSIHFYNKLPQQASVVTIKKFKQILDPWFKSRPFYSIEEFLECDLSDLHFLF